MHRGGLLARVHGWEAQDLEASDRFRTGTLERLARETIARYIDNKNTTAENDSCLV